MRARGESGDQLRGSWAQGGRVRPSSRAPGRGSNSCVPTARASESLRRKRSGSTSCCYRSTLCFGCRAAPAASQVHRSPVDPRMSRARRSVCPMDVCYAEVSEADEATFAALLLPDDELHIRDRRPTRASNPRPDPSPSTARATASAAQFASPPKQARLSRTVEHRPETLVCAM